MTILVTGGAGFIGSHLCERLIALGHKVICFDSFDSYYSPDLKQRNIAGLIAHPQFVLVEADIRDADALARTFTAHAIDAVVHLAARAGVRPSILQPELYYDVNLMGTLCLLEAMRKADVKKLVFGSSSSVYGNNKKVPFSETDSVDLPISPYAASKKGGELLCHTYHHLYGFDVFCLRFFTVYGPRQRPDMAIHQFFRKILQQQSITLFGDGSSRRDYTFIDDIVQGVEQAINNVAGFEVINLGESSTITLIDLIRLIEAEAGVKADIQWKPMQPGDVDITYADIARARLILGYSPHFSMKDGIHRFSVWLKSENHA